MKCPNDQSQMEEGWLANGYWIEGAMKKLSWWIRPMKSITVDSQPTIAWKCPKCGKIELQVGEKQ